MSENLTAVSSSSFDLLELVAALPDHAKTLLVDRYLVDRESASARIFRVYTGTPAHFHRGSDEYLYVLSGRGTFWMEDAAKRQTFSPGTFLFFEKNTVHALPTIVEGPVVFLAIDVPRREPTDIIFVDPSQGTPESFIAPVD